MDPNEPTAPISGYLVERKPMEMRVLLRGNSYSLQQKWVEFSERDGYKEEWIDVPIVTEP